MIRIVLSVLLLGSVACAHAAETDEQAFKARIAECRTQDCLLSVAHLYGLLKSHISLLDDGRLSEENRRDVEEFITQVRGQLLDAEFYRALDDGRWAKMSQRERQEWVEHRRRRQE